MDDINGLDILLTQSLSVRRFNHPVSTCAIKQNHVVVSPGSDNTSDADTCDERICVCRGCDAVVNSNDLSRSPAADSRSVVDTVKQLCQHF